MDERYLASPPARVEVDAGEKRSLDCLALRKAAAIEGRLIETAGGSPPPTAVSLYREGAGEEPVARVRTDRTSGAFRFPRLDPDESYHLAIAGPDCLELARRSLRAGSPPLLLRRLPARSLVVEAVDEKSGKAVAPFDVTLAPPTFPSERPASPAEMGCLVKMRVAEGSGPAHVEGLGAGEQHLAIVSPAYGQAAATVRVGQEAPAVLTVRLSRDGCRSGRVVDDRRESPVADAMIATDAEVFESARARELAPPISTDAAGRFSFCPSYKGDREFVVHHPSYAPRTVRLRDDSLDGEILVRLSEGGTVSGIVYDRDGGLARGGRLSTRALGQEFEAISDTEGRYMLDRLPSGPLSLRCLVSPGSEPIVRSLNLVEGARVTADFGASRETSLRLLDRGAPVAEARVILGCMNGEARESVRTRTDSYGRLRVACAGHPIAALERERAWVFISLPSRRPGAREEPDIALPHRRFSGRLLDGDRRPIAGAAVALLPPGDHDPEIHKEEDGPPIWLSSAGCVSLSDSQGRFDLFVDGTASALMIAPGSGRPHFMRLPEGDSGEIVLEKRARLHGRVLGAGRPVRVALVREGAKSFALTTSMNSGERFDLEEIEAGTYTLVAWCEGMAPAFEPGIVVGGGDEVEKELRLTEGGRIRILFQDASHSDPATAAEFLTMRGLDAGWIVQSLSPPETRPSRDGGTETLFSHVPAGRYAIGCANGAREARVIEGLENIVECP